MALELGFVFREPMMIPALRPVFPACLSTKLAAPVEAKAKPAKMAAPAPRSAWMDFYSHVNADWLRDHPLPPVGTSTVLWR